MKYKLIERTFVANTINNVLVKMMINPLFKQRFL